MNLPYFNHYQIKSGDLICIQCSPYELSTMVLYDLIKNLNCKIKIYTSLSIEYIEMAFEGIGGNNVSQVEDADIIISYDPKMSEDLESMKTRALLKKRPIIYFDVNGADKYIKRVDKRPMIEDISFPDRLYIDSIIGIYSDKSYNYESKISKTEIYLIKHQLFFPGMPEKSECNINKQTVKAS